MKTTLFASLLLLCSLAASAQDLFVPETKVGIKGGVNLSRFNFEPDITQEFRTGYTAGLVFKHIAQPKLGVQLEVNYVQRGWSEILSDGSSYTRTLDYVEVPFMTHVAFGRNTRFILNLGPNASFLLSNPDSIAPLTPGNTEGYYQKEIDSNFMIALSLGIGLAKITSFGEFQLEARLTQGFNDLLGNNQGVSMSNSTNVGVTLAYLLSTRKKEQPAPATE